MSKGWKNSVLQMRDNFGGRVSRLRLKVVKVLSPVTYQKALWFDRLARPMIWFVKEYFPVDRELYGVEVGVSKGKNALSMLSILNVRLLVLVDPYLPYVQQGTMQNLGKDEVIAKRDLNKYEQEGKIVFVKKSSTEAVKELPISEFDFVYIDACHDYEDVMQDIKCFYPLVVRKGVIGGHDYGSYRGVR
ncbi:MAG TPA: class I SAM-dependent methyltransferase, partial [Candidatus Bathyarchaeia archaeon]|nr:class I SAM-dependent methyltransferase [Candidatus Bathyarchaeia archaeon]